ncbi:MAG: hypothetical protein GY679_03355 [Mycoplasma sp.]|nr:hypothetical protein [Mycoplasma sp.]
MLNEIEDQLLEQSNKYEKDPNSAVPVLAMTYDGKEFSNHTWNLHQEGGDNVLDKHAESIILKNLTNNILKPLSLIITVEPCNDCFEPLLKDKRIKEVFFILKKSWKEKETDVYKYIKKGGKKIKRIKFPRNKNLITWEGVDIWSKNYVDHLNKQQNIQKLIKKIKKGKLKFYENGYIDWKNKNKLN